MRVLVTGAGGQVGRELVEVLAAAGDEVVAADRTVLDVADRDQTLSVITTVRPDAVVHAGAWTAVDACETDPDRAMRVNALGTRHVAQGARIAGARVLYLSTDYVFDGEADRPYHEWDEPNPRSVYGRSKLSGERELAGQPDATIVRTSWVFGRYGSNLVRTALRLADQHETLTFVEDQRGHPTIVADLAPMVRRLLVERRPGLFHVTNQGEVSWFELVRAVLDAAGLDPNRVEPIASADLDPPRAAPRPANSVLDNAALRLCDLPLLPDFRESLPALVGLLR